MAKKVDCGSPDGITIGLIDGIMAAAGALEGRDLSSREVKQALKDLAECEQLSKLLDAASPEPDSDDESRAGGHALRISFELGGPHRPSASSG